MPFARVYTGDGLISRQRYQIEDNGMTDRKGNVTISFKGERIRCHQSRLLPIIDDGVEVQRTDTGLCATCKKCKTTAEVKIGDRSICCIKHGRQELNWGSVKPGPLPPIDLPKPKKTKRTQMTARATPGGRQPRPSTTIDFAALQAAGELWTKDGRNFDYVEFDVKSHVLLIDGKPPRKLCFNSYNGRTGKKARVAEFESFINNKPMPGGTTVGFILKHDIAQERKKLEKAGYVLATQP